MGTYNAPMPGGWTQAFTIKGDTPSDTELGRINGWIQQNFGASEAPAAAKPAGERGLTGSFSRGFGEVFHGLGQAPDVVMGASGDVEALRRLKTDAEKREAEDAKGPQSIAFKDVHGPGDWWRYGKEQVGELAGGLAGTAVAAAPTFLAGGIGGLAGMAAVGSVNSTRNMLLAQMAAGRKPEEVEGAKAAMAGVASGIIGVLPPGRLLGRFAAGAGMKAADTVTSKALESLAAKGVRGQIAKGVAGEAGTMAAFNAGAEMGEAALTRWQAGQEVMSPEGLKEIGEAGVHGAFGGAVLGGVAGAHVGAKQPGLARRELTRRAEQDQRIRQEAEAARAAAEQNQPPPPSPIPEQDKPTIWEAPPDTPPAYGPPKRPTVWEGGEPPPGPAGAVPISETLARAIPTVEGALGRPLTEAERAALAERLQNTPEDQRGIVLRGFINERRGAGGGGEPPSGPAGGSTLWEQPAEAGPAVGPPRQGPTVWEGGQAPPDAAGRVPMAETLKAATRLAENALKRPLTGEESAALAKTLPGIPEANRGIFMRDFLRRLRQQGEAERSGKVDVPPAEPVTPPVEPAVSGEDRLPAGWRNAPPETAAPVASEGQGRVQAGWKAEERPAAPKAPTAAERAAKAEQAAKPPEETVAPKAPEGQPPEIPPPPQGLSERLQDHWAGTSVEPPEVGDRMRGWLAKAASLDENRQAALGDYLEDWAKARRENVIAEEALPHAPEGAVEAMKAGVERRQKAIADAEANIARALGEKPATPPKAAGTTPAKSVTPEPAPAGNRKPGFDLSKAKGAKGREDLVQVIHEIMDNFSKEHALQALNKEHARSDIPPEERALLARAIEHMGGKPEAPKRGKAPAGKAGKTEEKKPALVYAKAEDGLRWSNAEQPRLHWQDRQAARNSAPQLASQIDRIQSTMPPDRARKALQEHLTTALVGNARPHDIALLRDAIADRSTTRKQTPQEQREKTTVRRQKAAAGRARANANKPPLTPVQAAEKALNRPVRERRAQQARDTEIADAAANEWRNIQRQGHIIEGIPNQEALRKIIEQFDAAHPTDDPAAIARGHVAWKLSGYELDTPYKEPPRVGPEPTVMRTRVQEAVKAKKDAAAGGKDTRRGKGIDAKEEFDDFGFEDPYHNWEPKPDPWGLGLENMEPHDAREVAIFHLTEDYSKEVPRSELAKLVEWEHENVPMTAQQKRETLAVLEDSYGPDRSVSRADKRIKLDHEYKLSELVRMLGQKNLNPFQKAVLDRAMGLVGDMPIYVTQRKNAVNASMEGQFIPKGEYRPPVIDPRSKGVGGFYSYAGTPHIVVRDYADPAALAKVVMHEAMHPVFNRALIGRPEDGMPGNPAFRARLQLLRDEVVNSHPKHDLRPYGVSENLHEFFTEGLSDPVFQRYLEEVKLSDEFRQKAGFAAWVRTGWDAVVDLMRSALGLAPREGIHTALDAMMRMADEGFAMRESGAFPEISGRDGTGPHVYAAMAPGGGYHVGMPGGPFGNASSNMMQGAHQGGALQPGTRVQPMTPARYNEAALHVTNYDTVKMLRKLFGGITGVLTGDRSKGERFADWWGQKQIDRFLPLDRLVQELRGQGTDIRIAHDPYGLMQASTGKVARANDQLVTDYVRPLADEVKAKGLKVEEILPGGKHGDRSVEGVAHLLSAEERNAYFRAKDPTITAGSGMTDAEIASRRQALMNDPTFNYNDHLAAAQHYFKLAKYINDTREAAGLIPPGLQGMGQHWLPLRDTEARADATYEPIRSPFSGKLGVSARNDPRAKGRQERSEDSILTNLVNMAKDSNRHAAHNEALQELYKLSQDPANHNFLEAHGTDNSRIPEHHGIMVKIGGVQHFMEVQDNRLATMFNTANLQGDAAAGILGGLQKFNNWARKTATVMSPEFIIANAVRDNMEAAFKGMGLEGSGLKIGEAVKNSVGGFNEARKAMVALRRANEERKPFTPSNDWERAAVEFAKHGGEAVSWGDTRKTTQRELDDLFERQDRSSITKAAHAVEKLLEVQGGAIENATRLSAFKALVDQGVPPEAAAGYARNVTVNFAQRGEWTPVLNTLYLFYNAGMQGTVGMFNAALRPGPGGDKVRKMLGGVIALGAMNAAANQMLMGEDDVTKTSKWAGIPDHEKQSNIIMAAPWTEKGYYKIPLPHGLAALYNIGRVSADMGLNPPRTAKEATGRISGAMGNLVEQVLPFGQTSSFANYVTPTILRPVWQTYVGEDALGRKLSPDQASMRPGEALAPSQNYWNSAAPTAVAISDWLHENTGGQGKHIAGAVEIPPGQITNLIQNLTGGAGAFLARTVNYAGRQMGVFEPKADLEGEQWTDIPIVRRFVGDLESSRVTQNQFLEAQARVNSVGKEYDDLLKNPTSHTGDDVQRLMADHGDELIAYQAAKGLGKEYAKVGQAMHAVERSEMDSASKRDALNAMKAQRTALQKQMMRVYHDLDAL